MGNSESAHLFESRVAALLQEPIPMDRHEFWRPMLASPMTSEQVQALLRPADVVAMLRAQPFSLAMLTFKCIEQLYLCGQATVTDFTTARNCLYILTRVMPIVLQCNGNSQAGVTPSAGASEGAPSPAPAEGPGQPAAPQGQEGEEEGYDFVENFFWFNRVVGTEGQDYVFTEVGSTNLQKPLGGLLVQLLLELAFCPGFTSVTPPNFRQLPQSSEGYPFVDPRLLR
eukprot:RCo030536